MWTRSLLKTNAKQVLRQNYWTALLVCIVVLLLSFNSSSFRLNLNFNYSTRAEYYNYQFNPYQVFGNFPFPGAIANFLTAFAGVFVIIFLLLHIFVTNPIAVGCNRYFMESRVGNAPFSTLFSTFGNPAYWNVVKVMFLKNLFIFLWSLLFFFPGIYKLYQYRMVNYLLAENPYLPYDRAFELSRMMTDGEKFNIFVLDLSFYGWIFLGMLLLYIGVIFVHPYMYATFAELYAAMRAKAFACGMSDEEELSGFLQY
ncbi:MAG: DUF975 family protein [Subdoligranulum sp.]|nr:DUF975 family protein [Subdoligranulum sp.]